MLAPVVGLDRARRLPLEEKQLLVATIEHQRAVEALSQAVGNVLAAPRPEDDGSDATARSIQDYDAELVRLQCELIREQCCWALPLDHKYGEQLKPPPAEHWMDAPGVAGG